MSANEKSKIYHPLKQFWISRALEFLRVLFRVKTVKRFAQTAKYHTHQAHASIPANWELTRRIHSILLLWWTNNMFASPNTIPCTSHLVHSIARKRARKRARHSIPGLVISIVHRQVITIDRHLVKEFLFTAASISPRRVFLVSLRLRRQWIYLSAMCLACTTATPSSKHPFRPARRYSVSRAIISLMSISFHIHGAIKNYKKKQNRKQKGFC